MERAPVQVLLGGPAGNGSQFFLARQFLAGQRQRGLGLVELGLRRLEFGRAFGFFQVLQRGAGLGQLCGGLIARGFLRDIVQREKRIAGPHLGAAANRQRVQRSGPGGGDIDKFSLHITLHSGRGRPAATGQQADRAQQGDQFAKAR